MMMMMMMMTTNVAIYQSHEYPMTTTGIDNTNSMECIAFENVIVIVVYDILHRRGVVDDNHNTDHCHCDHNYFHSTKDARQVVVGSCW
jgi:hypothetical protein